MSLRLLTILLVVLVLVPAGILAWLGWQGAAAWEEAIQARIDAELSDAAATARVATTEHAIQLEQALQARLDALAEVARRDVPTLGLHEGMVHLAHRLAAWEAEDPPPWKNEVLTTYERFPRLFDLRLLGAQGRVLWPRTYSPDDPASEGLVDRLAFDLRREADRLRWSGKGPAAVRAYWEATAARAPTAGLRAWARAEAALLPGGAPRRDPRARLLALESSFGPDERRFAARPMARLLLAAAAQWASEQDDELRRRWSAGEVARAPLTDEERRRVAPLVRHVSTGRAEPPPAALLPVRSGIPALRLVAPVAGGTRLQVTIPLDEAWNATAFRVMQDAWERVEMLASPWLGMPLEPEMRTATQVTIRAPGPFGIEGTLHLFHRDASRFHADRSLRRGLTLGGVVALLVLMLVGLFLVRRAVARERSASRLRDDFVANVSHELRTPLASVLLHADLLAESGAADEKRAHLARVVRAEGGRLGSLVEDLLDFEALSSGKRLLEPEPIDLAAAVRRAVLPYEVLAAREGVELEVGAPPGEVEAFADAHAVGRILANLLSNAWRHGRPSRDGAPGRIEVRLDVASRVWAEVEVSDDGPGIPISEREAVFERFRRGTASESVRGTGLGLALARDLAHAMEGDLRLEPSDARTAFRLRLPLEPDVAGGAR